VTAGSVVGGLLLIAIVVLATICLMRRAQAKRFAEYERSGRTKQATRDVTELGEAN
jgi:hypothetical protein